MVEVAIYDAVNATTGNLNHSYTGLAGSTGDTRAARRRRQPVTCSCLYSQLTVRPPETLSGHPSKLNTRRAWLWFLQALPRRQELQPAQQLLRASLLSALGTGQRRQQCRSTLLPILQWTGTGSKLRQELWEHRLPVVG